MITRGLGVHENIVQLTPRSATRCRDDLRLPLSVNSLNWTFLAAFWAGEKSDEEVAAIQVPRKAALSHACYRYARCKAGVEIRTWLPLRRPLSSAAAAT
jgi:hypothetical protein